MKTHVVALVTLVLGCAFLVSAAPITFNVELTGSQETIPNASPGFGTATVVVDEATSSVAVDLSYDNLLFPVTNGHIHCCNGPGQNAPAVLPFIPAGFVIGNTSGSFAHLFTGVSSEVIQGLLDSKGYINIHTTGFPGGEIRGDLVIPEPGTMLLLGAGMVAVWGLRWRQRT